MRDQATSDKCAELLEEINIHLGQIAGFERFERATLRVRSTAIDLQGRILRLEEKADAESESLQRFFENCRNLQRDLDAARRANAHLQSLINDSSAPLREMNQPAPDLQTPKSKRQTQTEGSTLC